MRGVLPDVGCLLGQEPPVALVHHKVLGSEVRVRGRGRGSEGEGPWGDGQGYKI